MEIAPGIHRIESSLGVSFGIVYGQTESSPVITQTAPDPTARSCRPSGIGTRARMPRELGLTRTAIPGVSRMPTHTPRSPAETPTSLALGAPGIAMGAPTRL